MAARTATKQPTLRRKAKNEAVTRLQRALRDTGFDPGPIDGTFGSKTQRAVKTLQASCGLDADGIVGPKTWAALAAKPAASALTHAAQTGATSSGAAGKPSGKLAVSKQGLEHIAEFEGFRPKLYNDPAGHATIGFGHLVHKGKIDGSEPAEFRKGISRERALELLRADAATAEAAVRSAVAVPLAQHQFDALVSFVFNVGAGAFRKSTLLQRINAGNHATVRSELARWNKGGGKVLPGLVRRREAEADLYERGASGEAQGTSEPGKTKPGKKKATASATADAVRAAQKAFNTCGFPCGKVDGEVGEATTAAVRRFQTAYAGGRDAGPLLKQDGVLGSKTVAAANQLPLLSPHFKAAEFRSKGDGSVAIRRELVLALEQLRAALSGRPLKIVSGYRDPAHNKKVGGATNSMHMHGLAADLEYPCTVAEVRKLKLFSGIGHKNDRVRHVDLRHLSEHNKTPSASLSNPTMWKY